MDIGPIFRAMKRNKLRFGLLAVQIAATLAIVANAVPLILDARRKMSIPSSFDEDNLVVTSVTFLESGRNDEERWNPWVREVAERVREIPGVRAATSTDLALWWPNLVASTRPLGSKTEMVTAAYLAADEHFPDALGADIDEGRWFTQDEVLGTTQPSPKGPEMKRQGAANEHVDEPLVIPVVVSRALGEQLFGQGPLVGKMLEHKDRTFRIIGVVRRYFAPSWGWGYDHFALFYASTGQQLHSAAKLIIRAEPGKAKAMARSVDERLSTLYGDAAGSAMLVSQQRDIHFGPQRMIAALMGLLIVLLLFVANLAIAGLTSFSVTERTRQIGVRRALGATTNDILHYFLMETGIVTTMGLALGTILSVPLNMFILRFYEGAKLPIGVVAGCALLLAFVALGAALPPALRASRISPSIATRNV